MTTKDGGNAKRLSGTIFAIHVGDTRKRQKGMRHTGRSVVIHSMNILITHALYHLIHLNVISSGQLRNPGLLCQTATNYVLRSLRSIFLLFFRRQK